MSSILVMITEETVTEKHTAGKIDYGYKPEIYVTLPASDA
jgi:hypothetical protein